MACSGTSRRSRSTARRSARATSAAAISCSRSAGTEASMRATGHTAFSSKSFAAAAFIAIALTALIGQASDWMALLNAKLLDAQFSVWRSLGTERAQRDVAVIGIDVDDLRQFSDPRDFWHPHYGRLLTV